MRKLIQSSGQLFLSQAAFNLENCHLVLTTSNIRLYVMRLL